MLLRFEGGPCDGREEECAETPERLSLSPNASDFLPALEDRPLEPVPPDVQAVYELIHVDRERGIAIYEHVPS